VDWREEWEGSGWGRRESCNGEKIWGRKAREVRWSACTQAPLSPPSPGTHLPPL
jgi:hypothetical protein